MVKKFFFTSKNYDEIMEFIGEHVKSKSSDMTYDSVTRTNPRMPILVIDCEKISENVHVPSFPDKEFGLFKLPDGRKFAYCKHDGTNSGPIADNWIYDPKKCETAFFENEALALEDAQKFVTDKEKQKPYLEYIKDIETQEVFCAKKSQKIFLGKNWRVRLVKKQLVVEKAPSKVY